MVVTDNLPDGFTFNDGASTASCDLDGSTQDPNDIRCTLASLAANQSQPFTVNVTPTQAGDFTNTANVTSDTRDPQQGNNTSEPVRTGVQPAADLSLTKTDSEDPVTFGETVTYTISVSNDGPNAAQNVRVTDELPDNATFVRDGTDGRCQFNENGPGTADDTVTCTRQDPLPAQETDTFQIVVTPTAGAVGGQITNRASVDSSTRDPNRNNNDAAETTNVNAADLAVDKEGPDTATDGQSFDYTIEVTNNGPAAATGVTVTDNLPDSFDFNSASASQGSCEL